MNGKAAEYRFDVYGRRLAVQRRGSAWRACWLGDEGKRRDADFVIPDFIGGDELARFLADLFHESSRPGHDRVSRLPNGAQPATG